MTTAWVISLSILFSSFLGSWHCAGMCSPVASLMSARKKLWSYHLGRLISYSLLGVIAGALGNFFLNNDFIFLRWLAAVLLSITLLYSGLNMAYPSFFKKLELASNLSHKILSSIRRLQSFHISHSSFVVGLLTAFLPCGWLYTYVTAAVTTKSPWAGAMVLALFWLGGLPALSALPWMLKNIVSAANIRHQKMAGFVLMGAGLYAIGSFMFFHS